MSAAPAVPIDTLDTLPRDLSPFAKKMQAFPPSEPDTQPGDKTLVRRLASSNLGKKIYPPLPPGMEEEIPDTYLDSQASNSSRPDTLENPALEPSIATSGAAMPEVNESQGAKIGEQGDQTKAVDIQKIGDACQDQDEEQEDLFHVNAPVSRSEQFHLRDQLQGEKKRKQAETGEDDPEEGEPRTKAEKAAAAKVKKDLAKAKAKAKAKAEAESKKALDKAKKKFLVDTKAKAKAKATGKPRPKPASRAKRQKTASKDGEGTAAPSNTEGDDTPAPMDEEPAPAVDAQKKTFAGRCRPSKQTPAARFDASRKVFNTHVKGKVQQASTMEAPGFYGLLQHTPLPLTICCTMGTYGLIKTIFIHQKIRPVRFRS